MEVASMETLHQAHLQLTPAPGDTEVKMELRSPQNPVTLKSWGHPHRTEKGCLNWANQDIINCCDRENSPMKYQPRSCDSKLNCRWAWRGASTCEQVVVTGQTLRNCPGRRREWNRSHIHWCGLHLLQWKCIRASKPWSKPTAGR